DVFDTDVDIDGFTFVFDGQQGAGGARQSAGILSRTSGLTLNNNEIESPSSSAAGAFDAYAVQTLFNSDQSGLTLTDNLVHADALFSPGGFYVNPGSNVGAILIDGNPITGTNLSQGIAVDTMSNVTVSNNNLSRTATAGLQLIFAGPYNGTGPQT